MVIGGLQRNSLIDYPGKMSCVLFLPGCNFHCPYCHNPDLARGCVPQSPVLDEQGVYGFLKGRKGLLDAVVISGGEPTLSPDLFRVCERIQEIGLPVKLDTNGSRPAVLQKLLDRGLVNYVAMDLKTSPLEYGLLTRETGVPTAILASIHLIMDRCDAYEFRTTCVRPLVHDDAIVSIAKAIQGARHYVLQPFHPAEILNPDFFQDQDPACTDADLLRFQSLASPWVEECTVR